MNSFTSGLPFLTFVWLLNSYQEKIKIMIDNISQGLISQMVTGNSSERYPMAIGGENKKKNSAPVSISESPNLRNGYSISPTENKLAGTFPIKVVVQKSNCDIDKAKFFVIVTEKHIEVKPQLNHHNQIGYVFSHYEMYTKRSKVERCEGTFYFFTEPNFDIKIVPYSSLDKFDESTTFKMKIFANGELEYEEKTGKAIYTGGRLVYSESGIELSEDIRINVLNFE